MKKITLLCIALFCFAFTWNANAQFAESFETEIPATWTVLNIDGSTGWVRENNPVGGAQDGTAVASLTYSASAHDDHLITPGIAVIAGVNDRLSYYIKSRSSAFLESYEVLLSTTNATAASFTVVLKASSEAPAAWTPLLFDLSQYVGQTVYVSIHATGTDEFQLFVDNVINDAIPSCPSPLDLTVSNITTDSADLGWTTGGTNTNSDIELGLNGFTPTGTPTVDDTSDNPYTASGLSPSTTYQFYVRADCGSGDTSTWSGPFAFTTSCVSVASYPYLESFEGITTGQPNCWSIEGTTTDADYDFTSFATGYVGRGMRFDSYYNTSGNTSELITPTFDASSLSTLQLKFYYKNPTGGNFEILVSSDNGATYSSLETGLTSQNDWIPKTYDLTAYISTTLKVKFKGTSNYGNGDARIYLDEVLVRAIPSCLEPSALTATNITTTSVDLDWTAGDSETAWEYALLTSPSSEPASGTAIGTNSYTGTLTPSTTYDFYVRADCTGNDYSSWIKISFSSADITPDCTTTPFPADGAIDVPAGDVTFSWTAPTTGPTPTSYNLYAVDNAAGDNPALIGNFDTTSANITILAYSTTIYWTVLPVNYTAEASGCAVWSFTTESTPGYCLAATYGQYPSAAYTPSICDGTTANNVTTIGYAGEYSVVNVVSGQTYQFKSSIVTDFVTISDFVGTTPLAFGTTPVTWTSDMDGQVRFYTHVNDQCEPEAVSRTRTVLCGESLGVNEVTINSFTYFPNPVKNTLTLKAQSNIQNVSIYNMLGQEIAKTAPNKLNSEIDMSGLQSGAYFLKVTINDATETIRVIKQ